MKLSRISFLFLALLFTLYPSKTVGQEIGLKQLQAFLGSWHHQSMEMRPDGSTNKETGTMQSEWYLGETYLKIECKLNGIGYSRFYTQFIGYDNRTGQFHSTYMYSGTLEKVFETGIYDSASQELRLSGVNPFSNHLENGINIKSTFKITKTKIILELMELRANGVWELGYSATFNKR